MHGMVKGCRRLSESFSYSASADGDRRFSGTDSSDAEEVYFQDP